MTQFHEQRSHQGLGNRLISGYPLVAANNATIHRQARLGDMLTYCHRTAA